MTDTRDCHVHVIGDREAFPLDPARGYQPPDAPLEELLHHLDGIGIDRAVVVQPSVYGFDNACLLDALLRSEGRCRGVAVPAPDVGEATLTTMHRAGVRGVRCNLINPGGLSLDQTRGWWGWMSDRGWHLQLQADVTQTDLRRLVQTPGIPPVVVDHMGYPPRGAPPDALANLVAALASPRVFAKLSAPYRISTKGPPHRDAQEVARVLLDAAPRRCIWASDWPHTDAAPPLCSAAEWWHIVRDLAGPDWPGLHHAADALYGA